MRMAADKTMSLADAVNAYVKNGSHISIGGFTLNRNPMAAVYEIIRQEKKNLHLYAHSNGQGLDELIGAGSVSRLEIAYGGTGRYASTCIRFRKAVESGTLSVEDYTNFQMSLRFMAGAMGLPFMPVRSGIGSDIMTRWGFSEEVRKSDDRLPDKKITVMNNPFGSWGGAEKVALVPAIHTDVAVIHVQKADPQGTAMIAGLPFSDIEQIKASKHVIITCEELTAPGELRQDGDRNAVPTFLPDAVCHAPFGAYPTACFGHYDYDPVFLKAYAEAAADDRVYQNYVNEVILSTKNHDEFVEKAAGGRRASLMADPETGYAKHLAR